MADRKPERAVGLVESAGFGAAHRLGRERANLRATMKANRPDDVRREAKTDAGRRAVRCHCVSMSDVNAIGRAGDGWATRSMP